METTYYKRGAQGKKVGCKLKTKCMNVRFKERSAHKESIISIGRSRINTIVVKDDPLVSRKHAIIEISGEKFMIKDLKSTNGTYVNKNPVPAEGKTLKSGDVIKVGKTELVIS